MANRMTLSGFALRFLFIFCIVLVYQQQVLLSNFSSTSSKKSGSNLMDFGKSSFSHTSDRLDLHDAVQGIFASIPKPMNITTLRESSSEPTILKNLIRREQAMADHEDITLATHITTSKFQVLLTQLRYWDGPASVAVYINSAQHIEQFFVFYTENKELLHNVSFHVIMEKTEMAYPHNILRNVAIETIVSDYFVAMDVDFIPMPFGCHGRLLLVLKTKPSFSEKRQRLFVLPAFQLHPSQNETHASPKRLPSSNAELLDKLEKKEMIPFRVDVWEDGHYATNYKTWLANLDNSKSDNAFYDIPLDEDFRYFEPYVVGYRPGIPRYWEDFRGYGFNKISFLNECIRAGYTFAVLDNLYCVHLDHPTYAPADQREMKEASKKVWQKFNQYSLQKYGKMHNNIFCPSCDEEDEDSDEEE